MNPYPDARPGSVPGSADHPETMSNTLPPPMIEKRKERRSI
jgi:hypothetical protein